jgi:hypothetical protein
MARTLLEIIFQLKKTGDADKDVIRSLTKLKAAYMEAAMVSGALVTAGYAIKRVFDATVGTMVAYADQVRSVQQSTGMSAEESSRLIQVLDDMKVSYEELQKVIQKNGDEFDYSVEGLARMSDQYNALSSAQEKAEFMQKRFGKSWISFVETMEQGGAKIRAAGDGISDGLILDQAAIDSAREYQKQIDNLSDSWEALKVSAGGRALIPTVDLLKKLNIEIEEGNGKLWQAEKAWRGLLGPIGQVWNLLDLMGNKTSDEVFTAYGDRANAMQAYLGKEREALFAAADAREAHGEALMNNTQLLEKNTDAMEDSIPTAEEMQKAIESLNSVQLSTTSSMQGNWESFRENYASISSDMDLTDDQRKQKLAELTAEHEKATRKIVLGMLEQQLAQDGLTTTEMDFLLKKGQAWGIYSDVVVAEARAAMREVGDLVNQVNAIPAQKTFMLNFTSSGAELIAKAGQAMNLQTGTTTYKGKAAGGPVSAGTPYIVGEQGMELFVPNQSGTIIPNNKLSAAGGGTIVVNFTYAPALGTADSAQIAQLAPVITNIVRQAYIGGQLGG